MGSSMATHASGSWYDLATDGQGFHIEILPDNRAVVVWFGYDGQGQQRWITGAGQVVGNRVDIPSAYLTTGGKFGSGFDPAAVQRKLWGELVFEFTTEGNDATGATLVYNRLEGAKHGQVTLKRLTHNYQPEASETMRNITGTWFDPEHNGEGFIVQALSKTEATLHWFTYTATGDQAWLVGKGQIEGDTYSFPDMQITSMVSSGDDSKTTQVSRQTWGSVNLTVNSCQQLATQYQSQSGSGKLTLKRLTVPVAVECR